MMEAVVTTELETGAKSGSAGSASAVLRKRMGDNLRAIGQHQDEAAFAARRFQRRPFCHRHYSSC